MVGEKVGSVKVVRTARTARMEEEGREYARN